MRGHDVGAIMEQKKKGRSHRVPVSTYSTMTPVHLYTASKTMALLQANREI